MWLEEGTCEPSGVFVVRCGGSDSGAVRGGRGVRGFAALILCCSVGPKGSRLGGMTCIHCCVIWFA